MIRTVTACRAVWIGGIAGLLLATQGYCVDLRPTAYSISGQSLRTSLEEFADQSGLQVVYFTSSVPDQPADPVIGRYPAIEALTLLLHGTPLTFQFINEHTVAIRSSKVAAQISKNPGTALAPGTDSPQSTAAEIVVTGTRQGGREVLDSLAPIQSIGNQQLAETPANSGLASIISAIVPSFAVQAYGVDQSNLTLQAKLRGLNPNHVLVLINGKRRHTTANLAIDTGSAYQGGTGADLNFIPLDAVDHIEVLTDGAAAQYGTDAIAGVINIILKRDSSGGRAAASYGGYFDGGGRTEDAAVNAGFEPDAAGYLNLSGEIRGHEASNRGAPDPRVIDPANINPGDGATYPNTNMPGALGYPYLNQTEGDAAYRLRIASFNSGLRFESGTEVYAFGTYGSKNAASYENYRVPTQIAYTDRTTGLTVYPFPFGFDPQEAMDEFDFGLTAGVKGALSGWNWDLSTTFGKDRIALYTDNSANAGLFAATGASPTSFYDGFFKSTQWTTTLDVNRDLRIGFLGLVNMAYGIESRRETFEIGAGTPASYIDGGAQSYPGFMPTDAGAHARQNYAGYMDFAANPIQGLHVDTAGRHEQFSDFGSANVAKLSARYDFSPKFAMRGSASTGFRAPTLAEEYYSATIVTPTQAIVQLAPNSLAARLLGLGDGLKPEKSTSFSAGFVTRPLPTLTATLDLFRINIKNRIVATGELIGADHGQTVSANVVSAIEASGNILDPSVINSGLTAVSVFTNGVDTRTSGLDMLVDYAIERAWGNIDWSIGATFSNTAMTSEQATPAQLGSNQLFNPTATSDLTTANPKYVVKFGARWTSGKMTASLQEWIYGPSSEYYSDFGDGPTGKPVFYGTTINVTPVTNLDLAYEVARGLTLSVGAVNLLNRYPTEYNDALLKTFRSADDYNAVRIYPSFSPFGINGGYYFAKASYVF